MKKILSVVTVVMLAMCMLAGCGKTYASVEEYFSEGDRIQQALDEGVKQMEEAGVADLYSDYDFTVEGNTMIYSYVFADYYEIDTAAISEGLDDAFENIVKSVREGTGVKDTITVEWVYYDPDGEEMYRYSNQG